MQANAKSLFRTKQQQTSAIFLQIRSRENHSRLDREDRLRAGFWQLSFVAQLRRVFAGRRNGVGMGAKLGDQIVLYDKPHPAATAPRFELSTRDIIQNQLPAEARQFSDLGD